MFSAYHREGFRACVEANAAEFLKDDQGVLKRNSEHDKIDVWKTHEPGVFILSARQCVYGRVLYLHSEQNTSDIYNPMLRILTQQVY